MYLHYQVYDLLPGPQVRLGGIVKYKPGCKEREVTQRSKTHTHRRAGLYHRWKAQKILEELDKNHLPPEV